VDKDREAAEIAVNILSAIFWIGLMVGGCVCICCIRLKDEKERAMIKVAKKKLKAKVKRLQEGHGGQQLVN